jgi:urocanate hydratase
MSGAQAGAAVITGCVGVIAEVDGDAVQQRVTDGYILRENVFTDLDDLISAWRNVAAKGSRRAGVPRQYRGPLGTLCARQRQVELGSDQTSCHNINDMGYCPVGYTFERQKPC